MYILDAYEIREARISRSGALIYAGAYKEERLERHMKHLWPPQYDTFEKAEEALAQKRAECKHIWLLLSDSRRQCRRCHSVSAMPAGCLNIAQWNDQGYTPLQGESPAAIQWHRHGRESHLYAPEQVRPIKKSAVVPAQEIDLLAAIFTVTRAAKRYRDAAQGQYLSGSHTFAGASKQKKEYLYTIKDAGIIAAYRAGRIQPVAVHGELTVYIGEGHCFHSLLRPEGWEPTPEQTKERVTVEAKPKGKKEPRLKDAELTLEALPRDKAGFVQHQFPLMREYYNEDEGDWEERYEEEDFID